MGKIFSIKTEKMKIEISMKMKMKTKMKMKMRVRMNCQNYLEWTVQGLLEENQAAEAMKEKERNSFLTHKQKKN